MPNYNVGDKVIVRIIPENHLLDHRDPSREYVGRIVFVHEDHRYVIVDFRVGQACIREGFKPEDVRPAEEE